MPRFTKEELKQAKKNKETEERIKRFATSDPDVAKARKARGWDICRMR
jgi:hypothetical protein